MVDSVEGGRYPQSWESDAVISDEVVVHIRPIRPSDTGGLRDFHSHLSDQSVYFRYFGAKPVLSEDDLHRLTTVDYQDRVALIATLEGSIVGVARYERLAPEKDGQQNRAEVAFLVRDDHQGHGIGSVLLHRLALAARDRGITTFVAETLTVNQRMLVTFQATGWPMEVHHSEDVVEVTLSIPS